MHKLFAETYQPNGLSISPVGGSVGRMGNIDNASVAASAQISDDKKTVVVRITNVGDTGATIILHVPSFSGSITPTIWLLRAPVSPGSTWFPNKNADNPYYSPELVSPTRNVDGVIKRGSNAAVDELELPPFTFITVEYVKSS
eukprot:SAG31_NODE_14884_length_782_cov_0.975110_1_plen_143_part_00